ncbi:MAG: type II toxin-antitoxin system RelE/ParE family toxin [Bacteroidota bacterium]
MKIKISSTALHDIQQGIDYYQLQHKGLGVRFEKSVHASLKQIKAHPLAASFLVENIRYKVMKKFPYIIVHEVMDDAVYVLRVFNTSLSPDKM